MLKRRLKSAIDAAAEAERLKYITPGAGQAMTYQPKADEARRLADDQAPDPAGYPLLSAEVGITASTLADVGEAVMAAYQQWIQIGALIEAARLSAKQAIDAAKTADAARKVEPDWPGVDDAGE
ncbi:hypothetical protein [Bosea sp. 2RAB26]|uniref:hypothetical protein n=1 Tax=Bosea sp. 2RAB26 TaxID=3237476 RepID=UPI003F919AF2